MEQDIPRFADEFVLIFDDLVGRTEFGFDRP